MIFISNCTAHPVHQASLFGGDVSYDLGSSNSKILAEILAQPPRPGSRDYRDTALKCPLHLTGSGGLEGAVMSGETSVGDKVSPLSAGAKSKGQTTQRRGKAWRLGVVLLWGQSLLKWKERGMGRGDVVGSRAQKDVFKNKALW